MVAVMRHFQAQGYPVLQAEALAYTLVKAQLELGTGQTLAQEPEPDLRAWPAVARQEAGERTARLVAGGWRPHQARILAVCITADNQGLALPGYSLVELLAGLELKEGSRG